MIKRSAVFVSVLLFCFGCQPKQEMTISEDKMVEILLDAHVLEASLTEVYAHEKDSINHVFYEQLFKIHQITPETYWQNLELIQQEPELMNRIYHRLRDSVTVRSDQVDQEKKALREENEEEDKKK